MLNFNGANVCYLNISLCIYKMSQRFYAINSTDRSEFFQTEISLIFLLRAKLICVLFVNNSARERSFIGLSHFYHNTLIHHPMYQTSSMHINQRNDFLFTGQNPDSYIPKYFSKASRIVERNKYNKTEICSINTLPFGLLYGFSVDLMDLATLFFSFKIFYEISSLSRFIKSINFT